MIIIMIIMIIMIHLKDGQYICHQTPVPIRNFRKHPVVAPVLMLSLHMQDGGFQCHKSFKHYEGTIPPSCNILPIKQY